MDDPRNTELLRGGGFQIIRRRSQQKHKAPWFAADVQLLRETILEDFKIKCRIAEYYWIAGWRPSEIGELFGMSESAVRARIKRLKKRFPKPGD